MLAISLIGHGKKRSGCLAFLLGQDHFYLRSRRASLEEEIESGSWLGNRNYRQTKSKVWVHPNSGKPEETVFHPTSLFSTLLSLPSWHNPSAFTRNLISIQQYAFPTSFPSLLTIHLHTLHQLSHSFENPTPLVKAPLNLKTISNLLSY